MNVDYLLIKQSEISFVRTVKKWCCRGIFQQQAPTYKNLAIGLTDSHNAAVKAFESLLRAYGLKALQLGRATLQLRWERQGKKGEKQQKKGRHQRTEHGVVILRRFLIVVRWLKSQDNSTHFFETSQNRWYCSLDLNGIKQERKRVRNRLSIGKVAKSTIFALEKWQKIPNIPWKNGKIHA